jgi:hypothetical protein
VIAVVRRVLEEDVMLRLGAELRHSRVESRTRGEKSRNLLTSVGKAGNRLVEFQMLCQGKKERKSPIKGIYESCKGQRCTSRLFSLSMHFVTLLRC